MLMLRSHGVGWGDLGVRESPRPTLYVVVAAAAADHDDDDDDDDPVELFQTRGKRWELIVFLL